MDLLVKLQMLTKGIKGEEVARELIYILAAMHDRALVNDAAMTNLLDVGCFSHTLDLVEEHFHMPTLSEFRVL